MDSYNPDYQFSLRGIFRHWKILLLTITVVGFSLFVVLILLGPQVGSVFSSVKSGIGGSSPSSVSNSPAKIPDSTSSSNSPGNQLDRKIIRNASIVIVAEDVEKTLSSVRTLATGQQGLVSSSNTSLRDDKTIADVVIQVPALTFDETMSQLRRLAYKVESESSTSQDVTEDFVDTDSQIRNLKASEAQFIELLKKAKDVNETLIVQRELNMVRGEIEKRQGHLNYLQAKSDFSTITIRISPKELLVDKSKSAAAWDFGKVVQGAWDGSVRGLQIMATVGITVLIYLAWIVPAVGIPLLLGIFVYRRFFRRSPNLREG